MSSADSLCKQVGPRSGQMKSRACSGSKLFDTFMEFLKSAEDIARHSITAFCHVHKGDFGFEVDKECFNF